MSRSAFATAVAAATLATTVLVPASAQERRVQAGELDCSLSSSIGLVVTSQRNVSCFFHGGNGAQAAYVGTMTRIGLDVGVTSGGKMVWTVFVNTDRYNGTLAGSYVGANVLIGGNNDSVALQPLSVQSTTGFNIAAGVSQLNLCLAGTQC
jgi:hypothetical protein